MEITAFVLLFWTQRPLLAAGTRGPLRLPPSLHSCPHLLGGKAWISPFPLSLPLKRSLSPSHLAPLLSFPLPPAAHYALLLKKKLPILPVPTCSGCPPKLILHLRQGQKCQPHFPLRSCCHSQMRWISEDLYKLIIRRGGDILGIFRRGEVFPQHLSSAWTCPGSDYRPFSWVHALTCENRCG